MTTARRILWWLGFGWMAWRLLGPEIEPRFRGPQERPIRVPGRSVFVGDIELFVRQAGDPGSPPLVLVHGWGFDGEMTFYRVIEPLAEDFRVIVPDHRDHGKSDWVRGPLTVERMADDLAGVLDAIGVETFAMFGYSLGGMVAQELVRRHPGRVTKLVLGATAAWPVYRRRPLARAAFWVGRALARVSRNEFAAISRRLMARTGALLPEHERWMHAALLRRDPTLHYEIGRAAWLFDSRLWIESLGVDTMVIVPTDDFVVSPTVQRQLASLVGGDRVVELTGAGHESIMTRSDDYVKQIKAFLLE
jgi:3-oxoadipate enol-lactonase